MQLTIVAKQLLTSRLLVLWVKVLLVLWVKVLLVVIFTPASVLCSENLLASSAFKAGQQSFQNKEYEQALGFFEQAQRTGLKKPALFYNIGVCSYKLGLYDKAIRAFERTATFPKMATLAYYNLAVIAEKQGDSDTAVKWLEKSVDSAGPGEKDHKLLLLSKTALSRILGAQGLASNWFSYSVLGFGYDDNVSMVGNTDLDLMSEMDDSFRDIFALIRSPFYGDGTFFQGSLVFRDYTDLNDYDSGTLRLDGRYQKTAGTFQLEGGTGYRYVFWDHSGYSQSPMVDIQARHPLGTKSSCLLRYELQYFDILNSNYDYLRGWQYRTITEFVTETERYRFLIGYTFEENDRDDHDYSPRRHQVHTALELYPVENINIIFSANYRDSSYDIAGSKDRQEDRYEASIFLSYRLSLKWDMSGRFTRTVNSSNDSFYEFTRNITSVNLGYSF